jgi:aarF domain-containing kinase
MNSIKSSVFGRSFELVKLAAKVGTKELLSGGLKSRIDQARMITESLGELKGAAMKVGQMLSLELADYFPPEAIAYLAKLQNQSPSVDFAIIEKMIESELGDKALDLQKISRKALAAASIGQVHRAQLFDEPVVVKVQYPGVREAINSDLKVVKRLARSLVSLSGRKVDLEQTFNEFQQTLTDEANYVREAKYLELYGTLIHKEKNLKDRIYLPQAKTSHSTERVLTMSYVPGIPMREWMEASPSMGARENLAHLILELYCVELYQWGVVQTDPNFANFLVHEDRLGLLDFGATKEYSEEFRKKYVKFLRALNTNSVKNLFAAAVEFELLSPKENLETQQLFFDFLQLSVKPFMTQETGKFDFASQSYSDESQVLGRKFVLSLKHTPPPAQILFLHRRLGGTFAMLKKMKVQIDVRPYWERIVE